MALIDTIVSIMVTSIQVNEKTKKQLFEVIVQLENKKKRKVTYDEAIVHLIEYLKAKSRKKKLSSLFGCIEKEKAQKDLTELKHLEERKFERLVSGNSD